MKVSTTLGSALFFLATLIAHGAGAQDSPFPEGSLRQLAARGSSAWAAAPWADEEIYAEVPSDSNGAGGQLGYQQLSFRASNGKASRYKVTVPADIGPNNSYGLIVYLHGDGGADYDWFYDRLVRVASRRHLIPVAVLSPTANGNGPSWWWDADQNAIFLDELLRDAILPNYNVDKAKVIFTGASGGPTFLSGPWIRYFASQYRGGSINFCGGMVQTSYPFRGSDGFQAGFPLFFYNGTADFLLPGAQQAIAYYQGKGMRVRYEFPLGIGHCGFSAYMDRLMDTRVEEILTRSSLD